MSVIIIIVININIIKMIMMIIVVFAIICRRILEWKGGGEVSASRNKQQQGEPASSSQHHLHRCHHQFHVVVWISIAIAFFWRVQYKFGSPFIEQMKSIQQKTNNSRLNQRLPATTVSIVVITNTMIVDQRQN